MRFTIAEIAVFLLLLPGIYPPLATLRNVSRLFSVTF
jgi:hypothetical protein